MFLPSEEVGEYDTFEEAYRATIRYLANEKGAYEAYPKTFHKYNDVYNERHKNDKGKVTSPVASESDLGYNRGDTDYTSPEYETLETRKPVEARDMQEDKKRRAAAAKRYGLLESESQRLGRYVDGYLCFELNKRMINGTTTEGDLDIANSILGALLKMPEYSGRVYRNLKFRSESSYNDFLSEYSEGNTVTLKSFASTSKLPNGYPKYGGGVVHLVIDGVSGRDISDTFGIPRQQEVVLLPDTKIKIKKVTVANDGNTLIFAQEVETNENIPTETDRSAGDNRTEEGVPQNMLGSDTTTDREGGANSDLRREARHRRNGDGVLSEWGKSPNGGDVLGSSKEARGKNANESSEKGNTLNSLKNDTTTQQNNNEEAVDESDASTASSAYSEGDGVPPPVRRLRPFSKDSH